MLHVYGLKVDMDKEAVLLPINGHPVPFAIHTIKNVVMPEPDNHSFYLRYISVIDSHLTCITAPTVIFSFLLWWCTLLLFIAYAQPHKYMTVLPNRINFFAPGQTMGKVRHAPWMGRGIVYCHCWD